jgi:hypothetical protein
VNRGFQICLGAGAVVLVLAILSGLVAVAHPCGRLAPGYPPMVAFELARTGDDLRALFGDGPGPCRTAIVDAMDRGNLVDLALFTPAYCVFVIGFFAGVRGRAPGLARAGIALILIAGVADVVEDVCLLGLTPAIDPASPWLARLPWITAVKWLALGAVGAAGGLVLVRGGPAGKLGAALCLLAPIAAIAAIAQPARFGPTVVLGIAASWVVFLATAVRHARRVRIVS